MVKTLISLLTRFIPRTVLQRGAHLGLKTFCWVYAGSKYKDPIDGRGYRKLLPYGRVRTRVNALSPSTLSLERHRALWVYMKEQTRFFDDNLRMLHLAPEYCYIKRFKSMKNLDYVTGDLDSPWADYHFDVHSIPFNNDSFDVLMANHLLEHVEDDFKVMDEFYRVLKPGGWGVLQVPIDWKNPNTEEDKSVTAPDERERLYWQSDHVRLYGYEDYPDRLRNAGFKVEVVDMKALLGDERYDKYCLGEEKWVFVVTKP